MEICPKQKLLMDRQTVRLALTQTKHDRRKIPGTMTLRFSPSTMNNGAEGTGLAAPVTQQNETQNWSRRSAGLSMACALREGLAARWGESQERSRAPLPCPPHHSPLPPPASRGAPPGDPLKSTTGSRASPIPGGAASRLFLQRTTQKGRGHYPASIPLPLTKKRRPL